MNKCLFIILLMICVFFFSISCISAREDTNIDLKLDSFGYCVIVTINDSNNNSITNELFDINITKNNKLIKNFTNEKLNGSGENTFYLGEGEFKVDVYYNGSAKYYPSALSKNFSIHKTNRNSIYYYYDNYNYGDNLDMDEYIYDNFWDEEIYDDPYTYDGEGY